MKTTPVGQSLEPAVNQFNWQRAMLMSIITPGFRTEGAMTVVRLFVSLWWGSGRSMMRATGQLPIFVVLFFWKKCFCFFEKSVSIAIIINLYICIFEFLLEQLKHTILRRRRHVSHDTNSDPRIFLLHTRFLISIQHDKYIKSQSRAWPWISIQMLC